MKDNFGKLEKAIKNAINVFSEINVKINSLLKCSAKDFIILNKTFQEYGTRIKFISAQINSTLELAISIFKEADKRPDISKTESEFNHIQEEIINSDNKLNEINKHLGFFQLLSSNVKQDIGTLRLLATNLRFTPSLRKPQDSIIKNLTHINKCTSSFSEKATSISQEINSLSVTINTQNDKILTRFANTLQLTADQFESKNKQLDNINNLQTEIAEINKSQASSSSEIITNLQFDDIIRQKIEHIKEAQEKLLLELKINLEKQDYIKKDLLIQVKNIGTLQAAQLIHANQEYQVAIERIINLFSELNSILNKINGLWQLRLLPIKKIIGNTLSKLLEHFPSLQSEIISSKQVVDQIESKTQDIVKKLADFNMEYVNFRCVHSELADLRKNIVYLKEEFKINNKDSDSAKFYSDEINNIEKNLNEISKHQDKINKILEDFKKEKLTASQFSSIKLSIDQAEAWFNLQLKDKQSETLLKIDTGFDRNETNNYQFKLKDISYYTKFEKEVELINVMLNDLITKLDIKKDDAQSESSIEELQKLYTMKSEREVHQKITGKKSKTDSLDKEQENDIEFF